MTLPLEEPVCESQAICCVCGKRYGKDDRPDGSHGYCKEHAIESVEAMGLPSGMEDKLLDWIETHYD